MGVMKKSTDCRVAHVERLLMKTLNSKHSLQDDSGLIPEFALNEYSPFIAGYLLNFCSRLLLAKTDKDLRFLQDSLHDEIKEFLKKSQMDFGFPAVPVPEQVAA